MKAREANFDGIVGPTHNYAGLSFGNLASSSHAARIANPRAAVRQGLLKMRTLAQRGILQGVLPPHERPSTALLRALGFTGSDAQVLQQAARDAPRLLAAAASASPMWAANAATVSASVDCADGRVHFTPANLASNLHRSIEAATTMRLLQAVFADPRHFVIHTPLPATSALFDEGAANHMRLCTAHGEPGVECFVYGRAAGIGSAAAAGDDMVDPADAANGANAALPSRFPARQTREAGEAIARRHGLMPAYTTFIQQLPEAIDAGVFHNDVIAVADQQSLFCHQRAFVKRHAVYDTLRRQLDARGGTLQLIEVPDTAVSIDDAVASYLFNSQLIAPCVDAVPAASVPSLTRRGALLVAPIECLDNPRVRAYLDEQCMPGGPFGEVLTFDLRESMHNGGGPACLRLRVVLTAAEQAAVAPGIWMDERLFKLLDAWAEQHYRDRLTAADLADPALLDESCRALDELTQLLGLGSSLYAFQRSAG